MTTAQKTEKTEKTTSRRTAEAPDLAGLWETTFNMQRQWMNAFMGPMGFTPSADAVRHRGEAMAHAWLDHVKRMSVMTHELANDELATMREFSDKAFAMSRKMGEHDPKDVTPDFTRNWLEAGRRSAERFYDYGIDSMKSFEKLGLKLSDLMMPEPAST